jgi:hypothetical protein
MSGNTGIIRKARILIILLSVVLAVGASLMSALPVAAAGVSFYVATTGDNTNDGLSWQTAWQDIQYAINQAGAGDTINVAAGIYNENITLKDGVAVLGAGADVTIIDGGGNGTVITADSVGPTTRLEGFTVTRGNAPRGGGMYNKNSSPVVTGCVFLSNTAACGGGIYNYHSSPTITSCTFSANSVSMRGGGIYNYANSSPVVANCIFSANSAADQGGGMYNNDSSPSLTNCTFSSNTAACGGGMYNYRSSPTVNNCILWDSDSEIYNVILTPLISYSDVRWGYVGEGNIDADPLFVDPAAGDYHLSPGSLCLDAGNNGLVPDWLTTDFEGDPRIVAWGDNIANIAMVDMGADECYLPANSPPPENPPPPTTPEDAEGTVASVSPPPSSAEPGVGEMVNISVAVTNTTSSVGSYRVILKINDAVEATKELTLDAGAIESATFTVPSREAGSYSIVIEGAGGSFTVTAPQGVLPAAETSSRWFVVGGIIAGVVVIGLLFFFFVVKKRARWAIYLWFR